MAVFLGVDLSAYRTNSKEYRNVKRMADFLHDVSNASRSQSEEPGTPGGGASIDATYLVLNLSTVLTKERVLVAQDPITLQDLGPNQQARLSLNIDSTTLDVFLRADGSILGTGTQEWSNAVPTKYTNTDPTIEWNSGTTISHTLTWEGPVFGAGGAVRYLFKGNNESFSIAISDTVAGFLSSTDISFGSNSGSGGGTLLLNPGASILASSLGDATVQAELDVLISALQGDILIAAPNGFVTITDSTTTPTESLKTLAAGAGTIVTSSDVAYRIETTAADLTLRTITSGDIVLDPAGIVSILAPITAESITLSSATPITLLASSSVVEFGTGSGSASLLFDTTLGSTSLSFGARLTGAGFFIGFTLGGSTANLTSTASAPLLIISANGITLDNDTLLETNTKLTLGNSANAEFFYNGTNLILDPDVVGSGVLAILGDCGVGTETPVNSFEVATATMKLKVPNSIFSVFLGTNVFTGFTEGSSNVGIGFSAGRYNNGGGSNVYIGTEAGQGDVGGTTTSAGNVAIGGSTLKNTTTGGNNVAIGNLALTLNTTGTANMGIGQNALASCIGATKSVAIGDAALRNVTDGIQNLGIGASAGLNLTTGASNVAVGTNALFNNQTGLRNVAVGEAAGLGSGLNSYSDDTIIGNSAGLVLQTGLRNVFIGQRAGDTTTSGSDNIFIGKNARGSSATGAAEINIGDTIFGKTGGGSIGIGADDRYHFEAVTGAALGDSHLGYNTTSLAVEMTVDGVLSAAFLPAAVEVDGADVLAYAHAAGAFG